MMKIKYWKQLEKGSDAVAITQPRVSSINNQLTLIKIKLLPRVCLLSCLITIFPRNDVTNLTKWLHWNCVYCSVTESRSGINGMSIEYTDYSSSAYTGFQNTVLLTPIPRGGPRSCTQVRVPSLAALVSATHLVTWTSVETGGWSNSLRILK